MLMVHFTVFFGNAAAVSEVLVMGFFLFVFLHYSAEFYICESSFIGSD